MVIDLAYWKAARQRPDPDSGSRFLGRPAISTARCTNCGTALLGFPEWREADLGGWIEFEEECVYGCKVAQL